VLARRETQRRCPLTVPEQVRLFDALLSRTHLVEVYYRWRPNLPDEGDNHVLELAVAAGDAPIVTYHPRRRLLFSGLLTEACVSFPVLSALAEDYEIYVVADACGGITTASHELALRRMEAAGAQLTSWIQVLLEFQRDWTRHETYEQARAIVEAFGGGYGIGLAYARDMIKPG
jgi:nicotinamidase-related amidase